MTRILVLLVACASCIETALQPCGDGLLCPANTICVAEQSLCVSQEQLDACQAAGALEVVDSTLPTFHDTLTELCKKHNAMVITNTATISNR